MGILKVFQFSLIPLLHPLYKVCITLSWYTGDLNKSQQDSLSCSEVSPGPNLGIHTPDVFGDYQKVVYTKT